MTKYRKKYLDYLKSVHWKNLRARKVAISPTCVCCVTPLSLQVHHANYRNLTDCTVDDLVTLCEACHKLLHSALAYFNLRVNEVDANGIGALIDRFKSEAPVDWSPRGKRVDNRPKKETRSFSKACRRIVRKVKKSDWSPDMIRWMVGELQQLLVKHEVKKARMRSTQDPF